MNYQLNEQDINIKLTNNNIIFTLSNINKQVKHAIACLYFVNSDMVINSKGIRHNLGLLNINSLNIFYITYDYCYCNLKKSFNYKQHTLLNIEIINSIEFKKLISEDVFNDNNPKNLYITDNVKLN